MLYIRNRLIVATLLALMSGCSQERVPELHAELPRRLSELDLYSDLRTGSVVADLRPYLPTFSLWSDGASKRRWVRLPAGGTIDTSDMDAWRFPVGTEFFKEFSVDGKRIETRILRKVNGDDSGWAAMSYAWNDAQNEAFAAPDGVVDALNTTYDIPAASDCMATQTAAIATTEVVHPIRCSSDRPGLLTSAYVFRIWRPCNRRERTRLPRS